ncbi:MAG: hypothetical protein AAFN70_10405 [Planctomycetota bacterium]
MNPIDPSVSTIDIPRLTGQNAMILERLKRGRQSNRELAKISLKYTSRISDLRKHLRPQGFGITCARDSENGITWYEIVSIPTPQSTLF